MLKGSLVYDESGQPALLIQTMLDTEAANIENKPVTLLNGKGIVAMKTLSSETSVIEHSAWSEFEEDCDGVVVSKSSPRLKYPSKEAIGCLRRSAPEHRSTTARRLWTIACLIIAAAIVGWPSGGDATPLSAAASTIIKTRPLTKPIEQIRVGERVAGRNPVRSQVDESLAEPEPRTWCKVCFAIKQSNGLSATIELLRPTAWLTAIGAETGKTVHLHIPDINVRGAALVTYVGTCPPIDLPNNRYTPIVTGVFRHETNGTPCIRLHVDGDFIPLLVTGSHPCFSEDRCSFVPAGQLQPGERIRTRGGVQRVRSLIPFEHRGTLYNLETHGEHVFMAGSIGALVHNTCYTPDQRALQELIDDATLGGRRPLTVDNANAVLDMADEIGYPGVRAGANDVGTPSNWIGGPHIHVPGTGRGGHVPVEPGVRPR